MAGLLRLTHGDVTVAPERRVIRAEDYQAWVAGQDFLEAAKAHAREIEAEARAAYAAEKERGYQDGLAEAAMKAAEQQLDTIAQTVAWFERVENQVAELVIQATEKILGELDEVELVKRVVQNAMRVMRNQRQVTLRVTPELVESVQKQLAAIMADYPGVTFVDVAPDARLRRGGCILESELGVVDATVELQLEALKRALRRAFQRDA
ncbi:MAG TPA: HrpE/YscL family type III secretion apparatus protein [Geminicoccaceae bacterium]|nr:HrpE/YscL family type III secretion apparatus protein [Geminicoccaceae bacterium]